MVLAVPALAAVVAAAESARTDAPLNADGGAKPRPARQPRLSDWLLQRKTQPDDYPLGVSWRVPAEVPAQTILKLELVSALAGGERDIKADPGAMQRLKDWIAGLPATGRVPVVNADGRWLQVNPAQDPVLGPGHTLVMPRRPATVTVLRADGTRCAVLHGAGREARSYVDACAKPGTAGADWAWIAQPDGRVQRFGIAAWNGEKQDEPAAGAWIWAPPRGSGWTELFSDRLIRFIGTQGPAPDAGRDSEDSTTIGAAPGAEPADEARGATGGMAEGIRLSGGMSLGLSDPVALAAAPPRSNALAPPAEAVIVPSEARPATSRNPQVSSSDWGGVGLLQTPTARMREAGHLSFHYSRVQPYSHGNVIFQPFEWMEAGFRYTSVSNRLYGPVEFSGNQAYKDKSIDVKFRAWKESAYVPEIAVGLRDIGGTGLFAGEYLVASKRTGDLDWSLGMGWGYAGARGDVRNPLGLLSSRFDERTGTTAQGGDFSFSRYFRGRAALFGGVQYHTPWQPLTLKLEYEGNDYQHEPQLNNQTQRSAVNVGMVYQAAKGIDLSLGVERGNTVMFGVTLHTDLQRLTQPKLGDPKPVAVADARPARDPDWSRTARDLATQTDWTVRSIEQRGNEVRVVVDDAAAVYWRDRVDRATAVLHRDAPAGVDRFTLSYRAQGSDLAEHTVDREAWVAQRVHPLPPSERREPVVVQAPQAPGAGEILHQGPGRDTFEQGLRLSYAQTLGGPDAFVLWQLGLVEEARLKLRDDTWIQGSARLRLVDNYDKFTQTGSSDLPRVRTFLREYLTTSNLTMTHLQLTHTGRVGENHYYSAYGGYLEEMFAGAGGEWLYRPLASRFAFGVDVNAVRQREFEQHFGFRDYKVLTGHGTMYWDTGWNDVLAQVSVGRYLAKDFGATLQLSRVFANGVTIGAFATKTDVPAAVFGEGSFDKGIFISVPFDVMFTRSSNTYVNTLWRPLTRDGGAMLSRAVQLYKLTNARSDRTLWYAPAPLPNERVKATEQQVENVPQPKLLEPYTRVAPKVPAAQWERPGSMNEHRLVEALYAQGFRNVKVDYDTAHRIAVEGSNEQLRPVSRAAGRAARTALMQAPLEARGIEVTVLDGATVQARYEFFNLDALRRYFDGEISAEALKPYVKTEWLNPGARVRDPLERLDDVDPTPNPTVLGALVPDTFSASRVVNDVAAAAAETTRVDWLRAGALGAGLVLSSSVLDKRANRFVENHAGSRWLTDGSRIGNAVPFVAMGAAALAAIDGSDPRRSRTGYAALEAGAASVVLATGLKYGVGRARPNTGLGSTDFQWGARSDSFHSFPSIHTVTAWAAITPFALEYDRPWLYGVAALANLGRIGSRQHWVSDTVASSLIGYGMGRLFWQSSREQGKREPYVFFDGTGLSALWDW
jgi:membrane-associated phospholipid phosphatase